MIATSKSKRTKVTICLEHFSISILSGFRNYKCCLQRLPFREFPQPIRILYTHATLISQIYRSSSTQVYSLHGNSERRKLLPGTWSTKTIFNTGEYLLAVNQIQGVGLKILFSYIFCGPWRPLYPTITQIMSRGTKIILAIVTFLLNSIRIWKLLTHVKALKIAISIEVKPRIDGINILRGFSFYKWF